VSGHPVRPSRSPFLTSRSRFTLAWRDASGADRRKEFRLRGGNSGIFPERSAYAAAATGASSASSTAAEGASTHPVRQGRGRPPLLPSRQYVTFSDLSEEERAKIVRYRLSPSTCRSTRPTRICAGGCSEPTVNDVMRVMRRLIRDGIALHGQIVVCPPQRRAELARTLRDSPACARAPNGGRGPVGLTSTGRTAAAAPGHAKRGGGDARPAPGAGQGIRERSGREPFAVAATNITCRRDGTFRDGRPTDRSRRSKTAWAGPAIPGRGVLIAPEETLASGGRGGHRGDGRSASSLVAGFLRNSPQERGQVRRGAGRQPPDGGKRHRHRVARRKRHRGGRPGHVAERCTSLGHPSGRRRPLPRRALPEELSRRTGRGSPSSNRPPGDFSTPSTAEPSGISLTFLRQPVNSLVLIGGMGD